MEANAPEKESLWAYLRATRRPEFFGDFYCGSTSRITILSDFDAGNGDSISSRPPIEPSPGTSTTPSASSGVDFNPENLWFDSSRTMAPLFGHWDMSCLDWPCVRNTRSLGLGRHHAAPDLGTIPTIKPGLLHTRSIYVRRRFEKGSPFRGALAEGKRLRDVRRHVGCSRRPASAFRDCCLVNDGNCVRYQKFVFYLRWAEQNDHRGEPQTARRQHIICFHDPTLWSYCSVTSILCVEAYEFPCCAAGVALCALGL